jgi:hypothetical protein
MTQEQLCNWVLLAGSYAAATGDVAWVIQNWPTLAACAQSLRNRASPRTGVMAYDSSRCAGGQEITTYDSLDESLGQARGNTYLAAKCWGAWVALEMLGGMRTAAVGQTGGEPLKSLSPALAAHLASAADEGGAIPAVLEKESPGHASHILPAAEALVYPYFWLDRLRARAAAAESKETGAAGAEVPPEFTDAEQVVARALRSPLVAALRRHTLALLMDPQRRNLFPDGGLKLSSTSDNSWMSKIALFQHVTRRVLRLDDARIGEIFRDADAAHVRWQTDGGGYWACSDQMVSGQAKASRYYPRRITAALWMEEWTRADRLTIERTPPEVAAAPQCA